MNEAIQRAVKAYGSQVAMAEALKVKQPTISEWMRGERRVPEDRAVEIELGARVRGHEVLCEDLCDARWVRIPAEGWPNGKPLLDKSPEAASRPQPTDQPAAAVGQGV